MFRLGRGVSGRPSTRQGTVEEEPFFAQAPQGQRNLVRLAQSGFQIASNSAGVDHY